jgi:YVTN family beta-propeller protein
VLPTGVAVSNTRAYVANELSGTVSMIDLTQNPPLVVATVTVGSYPDAAALSADGSRLDVPNLKSGTVSIINTGTNTVSHTVAVGKYPTGVVEVGGTLYVANLLAGTISVINPVSGTVTGTITLGATVAPSGLAASADGHTLYADVPATGRPMWSI